MKPKLIIFATGEKESGRGGSGFKNLVLASRDGRLNAEICAVVSNYPNGGVSDKARELGIPFVHFPKGERSPQHHVELVRELGGENVFVALSGCLWLVPMKDGPRDLFPGLDPRRVINIHPGPLPRFGGDKMYGEAVHKAVMEAYRKGEVKHSAVTMHFATKKYDEGPAFFRIKVSILEDDTPESLGTRVNEYEHRWQPYATDLVVNGLISWDGKHPESLEVPEEYQYL